MIWPISRLAALANLVPSAEPARLLVGGAHYAHKLISQTAEPARGDVALQSSSFNLRSAVKNLMARSVMSIVLLLSLASCISSRSYVDPSFSKTTYNDIKRHPELRKWQVSVEFRRQGVPYPSVDRALLQEVDQVIRATGLAVPVAESTGTILNVVVNNFGNRTAAAAKDVGTGLTLGVIGSTVTDRYEMTVALTENDKSITKSGYTAAIDTTIGNTSGPPGVEPLPASTAFNKIVEQMLLNALGDLQAAGR